MSLSPEKKIKIKLYLKKKQTNKIFPFLVLVSLRRTGLSTRINQSNKEICLTIFRMEIKYIGKEEFLRRSREYLIDDKITLSFVVRM